MQPFTPEESNQLNYLRSKKLSELNPCQAGQLGVLSGRESGQGNYALHQALVERYGNSNVPYSVFGELCVMLCKIPLFFLCPVLKPGIALFLRLVTDKRHRKAIILFIVSILVIDVLGHLEAKYHADLSRLLISALKDEQSMVKFNAKQSRLYLEQRRFDLLEENADLRKELKITSDGEKESRLIEQRASNENVIQKLNVKIKTALKKEAAIPDGGYNNHVQRAIDFIGKSIQSIKKLVSWSGIS